MYITWMKCFFFHFFFLLLLLLPLFLLSLSYQSNHRCDPGDVSSSTIIAMLSMTCNISTINIIFFSRLLRYDFINDQPDPIKRITVNRISPLKNANI